MFKLTALSTTALFICAFAAPTPPNIIVILADDLDQDYKQNRLELMPNLRTRIRDAGVELINHVAAQPVCGPSRSSLLAGRFPHNVGYVVNDEAASIARWTTQENNTWGTWLTAAGYHTAFFGKYVNSMESHTPAGWGRWSGFSSGTGTYNFYNATMYECSTVNGAPAKCPEKTMTGVHQAQFLGAAAVVAMNNSVAAKVPFFIQVCFYPRACRLLTPHTPHCAF